MGIFSIVFCYRLAEGEDQSQSSSPISGSVGPDAGPQQWRGVISVAYASWSELQEAVQRLEQLKRQAGMAGEFQM